MQRILAVLLCSAMLVAGEAAGSAHEPRYQSAALWPPSLGSAQAAYTRQAWEPARVLTWTASGWQEGGRSAERGPDPETDVVFPAGAKANLREQLRARHLTVEAGAAVSLASSEVGGNLWIRRGGSLRLLKPALGRPDRDTFCRSDNDEPCLIPNFVKISKRPERATEWIGKWKTGDELTIDSGIFVLAPGGVFQHTDRRDLHVFSQGTLVLLSGSTWEAWGNLYKGNDILVDGRMLVGTPERPLTADCTIGLSFKTKGAGPAGVMAFRGSKPEDVGLLVSPDATLAVHSADPAKARLVLRWLRTPQVTHRLEGGEPPEVAALPHGIELRLFGRISIDAVVFNDVLKGGIQLPDPARRADLRNASLGSGNGGSLDELFSVYAGEVPRPRRASGGRDPMATVKEKK